VTGWALATITEQYPEVTDIKVDRVGIGEGVVDVMTQAVPERNLPILVTGVNFGAKANDPELYRNQRCEAYGLLAERFRTGEVAGASQRASSGTCLTCAIALTGGIRSRSSRRRMNLSNAPGTPRTMGSGGAGVLRPAP
jgi:hypothetical protein